MWSLGHRDRPVYLVSHTGIISPSSEMSYLLTQPKPFFEIMDALMPFFSGSDFQMSAAVDPKAKQPREKPEFCFPSNVERMSELS